jgi:hypothetical protein
VVKFLSTTSTSPAAVFIIANSGILPFHSTSSSCFYKICSQSEERPSEWAIAGYGCNSVFLSNQLNALLLTHDHHVKVKVMLWPTVGQPVLVSSPHLGPNTRFLLLSATGLLMWGTLSNERTGLSFTIAAGPRQRSHPLGRVPQDS